MNQSSAKLLQYLVVRIKNFLLLQISQTKITTKEDNSLLECCFACILSILKTNESNTNTSTTSKKQGAVYIDLISIKQFGILEKLCFEYVDNYQQHDVSNLLQTYVYSVVIEIYAIIIYHELYAAHPISHGKKTIRKKPTQSYSLNVTPKQMM